MDRRIVILGGGMGGLVVANRLGKALPRDNDIVLVDREKNHLFNPSLLWLMVGDRNREQIQKPLSQLQKKGVRFFNAEVSGIDFESRTVATSKGEVPFDYLVIALGASMFPERLPGFSDAAYSLYDLSGVERIRKTIENFDKGRLVVLVSSIPFKCPAAPYEAALFLRAYFTKKRRDIEVEVVVPEPLPMGIAGPEVSNAVVSLLESRGIRFTPQHQAVKIEPESKEIAFESGERRSYDLLLGIPPHGVPPILEVSPVLGESGWVKINPRTLETELEGIYAIGDVTAIPLAMEKPLPKAGVFAHFQADVVAHRIEAKINGLSPKKEFDGRGGCFIELGDGRAGYASGDFYAEPRPVVDLKKPSRLWHWQKVLFEKWWLWRWF